jgi:hypothetical protein
LEHADKVFEKTSRRSTMIGKVFLVLVTGQITVNSLLAATELGGPK